MPTGNGEIYFIAVMMVLIFIMSFVAVYLFVRTYKKEMREKEEAAKLAAEAKEQKLKAEAGSD